MADTQITILGMSGAGNTRRDSRACNAKFRKAKQTENEDGVYDNI